MRRQVLIGLAWLLITVASCVIMLIMSALGYVPL
jgi:hypothetical protein